MNISALGYGFTSSHSLLANRRPFRVLTSNDGGTIISPAHPKNADDTFALIGTLSNSIPLTVNMRGGKAFKGTPGLDWRIYGSLGEIRITAPGPLLQIGYENEKIEVHDVKTDTVEELMVEDEWAHLPQAARNVARVYEAIEGGDWELLCGFEDAIERHELIDEMYRQNGANF